MPSQISVTPTYFFLTAAQLGSVAVAVFLVVSFALFWPLLTAIAFLQPTRMLFAYSFDGLLPKSVAKVSGKSHAPVVAVAISGALSIATLAWAIYLASNVFQVVTYIVLAQVISMGLVGLAALVFPYRRPSSTARLPQPGRSSECRWSRSQAPGPSLAPSCFGCCTSRGEARALRQAELLPLDRRHRGARRSLLLRSAIRATARRHRPRPSLRRDSTE